MDPAGKFSTMLVDSADAITLNVGGRRFDTNRATLRRGAPAFFDLLQDSCQSDVGRMRGDGASSSKPEALIDRDPRHFPAILNFLRAGRCALPDTIADLLELREEAEAYQVSLRPASVPQKLIHVLTGECRQRAAS